MSNEFTKILEQLELVSNHLVIAGQNAVSRSEIVLVEAVHLLKQSVTAIFKSHIELEAKNAASNIVSVVEKAKTIEVQDIEPKQLFQYSEKVLPEVVQAVKQVTNVVEKISKVYKNKQ